MLEYAPATAPHQVPASVTDSPASAGGAHVKRHRRALRMPRRDHNRKEEGDGDQVQECRGR